MYLAALQRDCTESIDSSHIFPGRVFQKPPKFPEETQKVGTKNNEISGKKQTETSPRPSLLKITTEKTFLKLISTL